MDEVRNSLDFQRQSMRFQCQRAMTSTLYHSCFSFPECEFGLLEVKCPDFGIRMMFLEHVFTGLKEYVGKFNRKCARYGMSMNCELVEWSEDELKIRLSNRAAEPDRIDGVGYELSELYCLRADDETGLITMSDSELEFKKIPVEKRRWRG